MVAAAVAPARGTIGGMVVADITLHQLEYAIAVLVVLALAVWLVQHIR